MWLIAGDPEILRRVPVGDQQHIGPRRRDQLADVLLVIHAGRAGVAAGDAQPRIALLERDGGTLGDARRGAEQEQRPAALRTLRREPPDQLDTGDAAAEW